MLGIRHHFEMYLIFGIQVNDEKWIFVRADRAVVRWSRTNHWIMTAWSIPHFRVVIIIILFMISTPLVYLKSGDGKLDWTDAYSFDRCILWPSFVFSSWLYLVCVFDRSGPGRSWVGAVKEGAIALHMAVARYDPSRGFRFFTYADWALTAAFEEAVSNKFV